MSTQIVFNDGGVREAAGRLGTAFSDVPDIGPASCGDCGSALVADTLQLFIEQFTCSAESLARGAERTSAAMISCADDFSAVESTNARNSRNLMEMMRG